MPGVDDSTWVASLNNYRSGVESIQRLTAMDSLVEQYGAESSKYRGMVAERRRGSDEWSSAMIDQQKEKVDGMTKLLHELIEEEKQTNLKRLQTRMRLDTRTNGDGSK